MPVIKSSNVLAENWLSVARDKSTSTLQFRTALENIGLILLSEALNNIKDLTVNKNISTPLKKIKTGFIDQKRIFIIPILRAGLAMLHGVKNLIPEAHVAHVGLYRNEKTLKPHWYLDKLPKKASKNSVFFIFEPMLATGGTITTVLERINSLGVSRIYVLSVIISGSAKKMLETKFPRVNFYVAGIDSMLNNHGYIVPGLGDAGDRAFNM